MVKEDVTLQNNSTLTILPNTVIFFDTLNTSNQPDRFQINIEGTLKAEGTFDNNIIFRSYGEIELNDPKQWDGLKFINNQNYSQISFNQFMHCSEALAITNSNIAEIKYSRFIKNTTALSLGLNNTSFKECYFNNYYDQSSYIKIQNESDPIFNECYFYPYNKNGNFLIELINSSQDIDATNCYWSYSQYNLDDLIFDKKDNSSLGEVNYIPFLIDPPDLSPGAEEVILDTKIDDPQENLHYVLGIPDNHKYFLNAGTDIILDMGNNSLVKNADSTDFKVYANEYKTSDSSQILIIVALSNDIEGNWEVCGIIQGESSFDIDELGSYSYRYIKISNHSINPTPNDSVGAFIDAVISTNYNYSPLGIDEYNGNYIKGNKTNYIVINPNPVRNTAKISILAPNTGNMEISLISLSGIKIKTLVSKYIKDGIHDMDIDLHNIPAGLYIINLVIDNKLIEAEKIIIY